MTELPICDVRFHGEYWGAERTSRGCHPIDADDPSETSDDLTPDPFQCASLSRYDALS